MLLKNTVGKGGILESQTERQLLQTSPGCKPAPRLPCPARFEGWRNNRSFFKEILSVLEWF